MTEVFVEKPRQYRVCYSCRLAHNRVAPKTWRKLKKANKSSKRKNTKIVSLQPNISDTPFNHKSTRPPEEGVLKHNGQTNRHTDRLTLRLYD